MEVKDVRQRVGDIPAIGQAWFDVEVFIAIQQIVEQEIVDTLRGGVDAHAWIQIRRAALDDHHQRVGVGLGGAGEKRKAREGDEADLDESTCDRYAADTPSLTHTKFSPKSQGAALRWQTECS